MALKEAPPVGLEEVVQTLEETLITQIGGNAGGNISEEDRQLLAEWAEFYGRAAEICEKLLRTSGPF